MTAITPTSLLRPGLLAGSSVAVFGGSELGAAVAAGCESLGAQLTRLETGAGEDALPDPLHTLVVDAAALFETGGLREATDATWVAIRAAGTARMIPAGDGRVVLLAPRPAAGEHAEPARDGLENLARTLSIEWARYGVRIVAIHPGDATAAAEVGALAAFLASPAGEYYSGCRFSLGEARAR